MYVCGNFLQGEYLKKSDQVKERSQAQNSNTNMARVHIVTDFYILCICSIEIRILFNKSS